MKMNKLALTRKAARFKKNNQDIYNLLLAIGMFLGVVLGGLLLMTSPLPGYLILQPNPHVIPLIVSVIFFVVIACSLSLIYWSKWEQSEVFYFLHLSSKRRVYFSHFVTFLQRSVIYHLFVFACFAQVTPSVSKSFLYICVCYITLFMVFVGVFNLKFLTTKSWIFAPIMAPLVFRVKQLVLIVGKGGVVRALAAILFSWLAYFIAGADTNLAAKYGLVAFFSYCALHMNWVLVGFLKLNINKYQFFYAHLNKTIVPSLYRKANIVGVLLLLLHLSALSPMF